jgi:hypothetical protein
VAREQTIRWALRDADLQPADIDYINAHGTSTPLNDINETLSLKKALGDEAFRIPVSSTKAYSGHLIAAAGSFETIVCLQAMAAGIMPATAHLTQPDPQCDLDYIAEGHRQGDPPGAESELWFRRRERRAGAGETRVTLLHYTLADALQWAAFSGDENPIHFDLRQRARWAGRAQYPWNARSARREARRPLAVVPP